MPLTDIAHIHGTPLYIYSQDDILARAQAIMQTAAKLTDNYLVCYAIKANGSPAILRLLGEAGLGADVTSGGELYLALHAGIPPHKIIFSGVGKTVSEIEMAIDAGIHALHVESVGEFERIAGIAASKQQKVNIGVRVNPNIAADTHEKISTGKRSDKFGVSPTITLELLREAAKHQWLHPVALALHIGSQIKEMASFQQAAQFLAALAAEAESAGISLNYLDAGGGLAIGYGEASPHPTAWVKTVGNPIVKAEYGLVLEPGRSLVGTSGALITEVQYVKAQGDKQFVIVDAGISDLIRPTLYHAHHPILPTNQQTNKPTTIYDVVGPICESGDYLAQDREMPAVQSGDLLAILDAGAYCHAMSSNYNGRPRAAEVLVAGTEVKLIRERETYKSLIAGSRRR